jgi:hypothetical protein
MGGKLCAEQQDCYQEMVRLFFNFLRISPSYTLASEYSRPKKLPRKMSLENRRVLDCYSKYGSVLSCTFEDWIGAHQSLPVCIKPPIIEVLRGKDRLFVCDDDVLLKLCGKQEPPSITQVVNALAQVWPNTQIQQIHSQVVKGAKLKNMWKDLLLIYTIALNPGLELWRLGSMAMLVDRFIGRLDPLAARRKSDDDYMRRHMTLMVMRHKDYALYASESAALGEFPYREVTKNVQARFNFEDENFAKRLFEIGNHEFDCAKHRVSQLTGFKQ